MQKVFNQDIANYFAYAILHRDLTPSPSQTNGASAEWGVLKEPQHSITS